MEELEGTLVGIEKVGERINEYTVEVGKEVHPACCYAVRLGMPGKERTRPYSPVRVEKGCFVCVIKIYPRTEEGQFTPDLEECRVGDKLKVVYYTKKIRFSDLLPENIFQVCMISGGTGITPMMQVLDHASQVEKRVRRYVSVSLNTKPSAVILKDSQAYPEIDLKIENVFTEGIAPEKRLTRVEDTVRALQANGKPTRYLVCGPDSLVEAVAGPRKGEHGGLLCALGVHPKECHKF